MKIFVSILFLFASFSLGAWLAPLLSVRIANDLVGAGLTALIMAVIITCFNRWLEEEQKRYAAEFDRQQRAENTLRNRDNMTETSS